jgi:predicted alpha/beta superfamily hydrolase
MKKCTLFAVMAAIVACVSCTNNKPMPNLPEAPLEVVSGTVYRTKLYHANFGDSLTVDIWTPDGYNTNQAYPVLYMHDGQNLFDPNSTWNKQAWNVDDAITQLVAEGKIEAPIVVGVHSIGETRIGDLMPKKVAPLIKDSTVWAYMDAMCRGQYRGDAYVDFLVYTVKPFVDETFSTKPEKEHTAVMGSSMGGLMSLFAITKYNQWFSKAACVSSAMAFCFRSLVKAVSSCELNSDISLSAGFLFMIPGAENLSVYGFSQYPRIKMHEYIFPGARDTLR